MSTPFQKAFPGADENTVFEVVSTDCRMQFKKGDLCTLHEDDGSDCPYFNCEQYDFQITPFIHQIRIKEPQLKKGDRCLVSHTGNAWVEREFIANVNDEWGLKEVEPWTVKSECGTFLQLYKYAKPLPQTQTVTLQDGTELTIPNDAVDKLREEYA